MIFVTTSFFEFFWQREEVLNKNNIIYEYVANAQTDFNAVLNICYKVFMLIKCIYCGFMWGEKAYQE